jgi:hypothetical protein
MVRRVEQRRREAGGQEDEEPPFQREQQTGPRTAVQPSQAHTRGLPRKGPLARFPLSASVPSGVEQETDKSPHARRLAEGEAVYTQEP